MNDQVTKNFRLSEFACRCGQCENLIDIDFIQRLQSVRNVLGKPLSVTSGYRCKEYNDKIGGSRGSKHMQGIAADILARSGNEKYRIIHIACALGFGGIGVGKDFIHLDTRKTSRPVVWGY